MPISVRKESGGLQSDVTIQLITVQITHAKSYCRRLKFFFFKRVLRYRFLVRDGFFDSDTSWAEAADFETVINFC